MATWTTVNESDLLIAFSSQELERIRKSLANAGEDDPVESAISAAVRLVRAYIAANSANKLATGDTVPYAFVRFVCDIAAWNLMCRPAASIIDVGDARKNAARQAMDVLAKVAMGAKDAPAVPVPTDEELDTETEWCGPGPVTLVSYRESPRCTDSTLDGL